MENEAGVLVGTVNEKPQVGFCRICHEVEKLARKGGKSALAPIPASDDEKARPLMPDFRRKKIWRTAGRYPHARQM